MLKTIRDEENNNLKVSIIIPCRNEEKHIAKCLDSIIKQEYPINNLEVFVVDGMSQDGTKKIIKNYIQEYSFIKLLNNPDKITPAAMNIGIKKASGNFILILGAHSVIDKKFIKKNYESLKNNCVDCVGGICITVPINNSLISKSISIVISHPFGVGNAYFRTGIKKLKYVDTVPCGCYRREVFDKIGLFDEDLVRNQDDEFNLRLIKNGGKILLVPDIISYYHARDSIYKLWKMYFQYGYFKPLVVKKVGGVLTWRQLIPPSFMGSLILALLLSFFTKFFLWLFLFILGLYTTVNFSLSLIISIKKKELRLLPFLIASFITLHFSYGFGYLKGIWDFIVFKKHLKKKIKDMPLTR
jgi:cellulose synthase/poly-beta-1,6-N-acetylglucosamine synthase-like glycosyltransferase